MRAQALFATVTCLAPRYALAYYEMAMIEIEIGEEKGAESRLLSSARWDYALESRKTLPVGRARRQARSAKAAFLAQRLIPAPDEEARLDKIAEWIVHNL